jgi:vacuolar-type H+-ATPase subunit I/STV1
LTKQDVFVKPVDDLNANVQQEADLQDKLDRSDGEKNKADEIKLANDEKLKKSQEKVTELESELKKVKAENANAFCVNTNSLKVIDDESEETSVREDEVNELDNSKGLTSELNSNFEKLQDEKNNLAEQLNRIKEENKSFDDEIDFLKNEKVGAMPYHFISIMLNMLY